MQIEIWTSNGERQSACETMQVTKGTHAHNALPTSFAEQVASGALSLAVWGRAVQEDYVLQVGDRIELTRALRVDPMTARRERFAGQGIKKAGLFKTRRKGAKAGY